MFVSKKLPYFVIEDCAFQYRTSDRLFRIYGSSIATVSNETLRYRVMILQPGNVELTKVYYYDQNKRSHNMSVSTISREMYQNNFNKNAVIKKKMFGNKWVLQINEENHSDVKKKKRRKLIIFVCASVLISIIIALAVGIIFSLDYDLFRMKSANSTFNWLIIPNNVNITENFTVITDRESRQTNSKVVNNTENLYCLNCTVQETCIKLEETQRPKCVQMKDQTDPTGCGGLCTINTEYCKNLDRSSKVYQCLPVKSRLQCPGNMFNCETMCVPLEKRCNGLVDCKNMLDEIECECDLSTHFQCGNGTSCLSKTKYCNGVVECWDKSDEVLCNKDEYCPDNHIPCLNGECIPKSKLCDNVFDCSDRTDEPFWCQQIKK